MLMGQSVLKIHKLNGLRYAPYGFFAEFDNELPLPVENLGYIASFAEQFHIDRLEKPGFSILVPYPDRAINPADSVKSAIKHYFFPIISGKLTFELRYGGQNP